MLIVEPLWSRYVTLFKFHWKTKPLKGRLWFYTTVCSSSTVHIICLNTDKTWSNLLNLSRHHCTLLFLTCFDCIDFLFITSLPSLQTKQGLLIFFLYDCLNITDLDLILFQIQFTLFLKEVGLPMTEALTFWKHEYSLPEVDKSGKEINGERSWQKDRKRYTYNIRHLYGLEGSKIDYKAHSCKFLQVLLSSLSFTSNSVPPTPTQPHPISHPHLSNSSIQNLFVTEVCLKYVWIFWYVF